MNTHLLVETGNASRIAICDRPFANGEWGSVVIEDVDCVSCLQKAARTVQAAPSVEDLSEQIEAALSAHALEGTTTEAFRHRDVDQCRCGTKHPVYDNGRFPTHRQHVAGAVAAVVERSVRTYAA